MKTNSTIVSVTLAFAVIFAKAPSDAAFTPFTTIICIDTSRFGCRVIPLSRTLLPLPSQWFD
jgi:hypothetical protein